MWVLQKTESERHFGRLILIYRSGRHSAKYSVVAVLLLLLFVCCFFFFVFFFFGVCVWGGGGG